jgi:hypothetical protein
VNIESHDEWLFDSKEIKMKKNIILNTLENRKMVSAAIMSLIMTFAAIFFSVNVAAQQNIPPNGRNVKLVKFTTLDGNKLGTYKQMNGRTWAEVNREGDTLFTFKEVNRDDSSVYLHDPSRDVSLQLNLHTRKIMYSDADSPHPRLLYNILGAK